MATRKKTPEATPEAAGDDTAAAPKRARAKKAVTPAAPEPAASTDDAAPTADEAPAAAKPKRASRKKAADEASSEAVVDAAPAPVAEAAAAAAEPAGEAAIDEAPAASKPKRATKKKAAADDAAPAIGTASAAPLADVADVPPTPPAFPATEYAVVEKILVAFLAHEVRKVGLSRAVLGLSGGVDSAVSAALAARALGPSNVLGVMMPYASSSPESLADAEAVAASLGIETTTVDITPQVDAYFSRYPDASRLRRGNKMARERMTILYDHSAARSALVVGTSNKTELLLGYGTLFGDMASALNPIGDLYKTQVWEIARHLGLPASVIDKAPTADLWSGQTDETELGFSYHEVDRLLYRMIDERCSRDELLAMGFDGAFVDRIARMVRASQFKRRLPVIAKVSARSIDTDFRYSRDWGL